MSQKAFVEEVADEAFNYADYEIHDDTDDGKSTADLPPEAPTPPPAVAEGPVNVFDFLVNATPNASTVNFGASGEAAGAGASGSAEETQLVRYDYESNVYLEPTGFMADDEELVQYGTGPVPSSQFRTPGARDRKKNRDGAVKKEKKRKRLHVDVPSPHPSADDMVMTDAPPAGASQSQTGLTAPLSRMGMRPLFPPSPDYSGGDGNDAPGSPLKKTKHRHHHHKSRADGANSITNNLMALITTGQRPKSGSTTKTKKSKSKSSDAAVSKTKSKSRHHQKLLEGDKPQKLLEYKPAPGAAAAPAADKSASEGREKVAETSQLIVYRPRANLFLSYVNKGPDSAKGCSMNKVLKRYLREREEAEEGLIKSVEEKELWKSLRMRRNDRGEIVLFTV